MVEETAAAFGGIDVLVNNAGSIRRNVPLHETPNERWEQMLAANLTSVFLVTRAALRRMLAADGDRSIVNVASTFAFWNAVGVSPYAAAKGGVVALTRSLAVEYAQAGIRANCVCPAVVRTPLVTSGLERMTGAMREEAEKRISAMPMLPPEEIAEAVYEIIRDDSAAGVVMGVTLGNTRRVVDPPITLPVTSGTPGAQQRPRG